MTSPLSGVRSNRLSYAPVCGSLKTEQVGLCKPLRVASVKGGDPAAPSGTATLLRLSPPYQPHLRRLPPVWVRRPTSGAADSGDLTGGVYKARERIHGGMADPPLLAIPRSRSRVADCDPN